MPPENTLVWVGLEDDISPGGESVCIRCVIHILKTVRPLLILVLICRIYTSDNVPLLQRVATILIPAKNVKVDNNKKKR